MQARKYRYIYFFKKKNQPSLSLLTFYLSISLSIYLFYVCHARKSRCCLMGVEWGRLINLLLTGMPKLLRVQVRLHYINSDANNDSNK